MTGLDIYEAMNGIDDKYLSEAINEEYDKQEFHDVSKEYDNLLSVMSEADIVDLKHTEKIKKQRLKEHKLKRWQRWAASAAAAIVVAFVGVVNLFPSVAYAMSDVVLLGDLARAVTFDPSMRACLENEYAQYVGEEFITPEGYHSKVYYMVVDPSRISIFYKSGAPDNDDEGNVEQMVGHCLRTYSEDGEEMFESWGYIETDIKGLYEARIDIDKDGEVPEKLWFELNYYRYGELHKKDNPFEEDEIYSAESYEVSKAVYTLYPDRKYTEVVNHYELNRDIEICGQQITVKALDVYPTQARLYFSCDNNENSMMVADVEALLVDDKDREYNAKSQGITGTRDDEGNVATKYYESSYFAEAESLKVVIKSINLLDKDKSCGDISYENRSIDNMPEGISVQDMKLNADGSLMVKLNIQKSFLKNESDNKLYNRVVGSPFNKETDEYASDNGGINLDAVEGEESDYRTDGFIINDYRENMYEMRWSFGEWTNLAEPVEISVE